MTVDPMALQGITPAQFRGLIRSGQWTDGALLGDGLASLRDFRGYARMNLVVLPKAYAFEFLGYCQRNPRAFYVSEICEPGDFVPHGLASDADLRTDVPRYCVYEAGRLVDEPTTIKDYWQPDSVAFLIGSSASFNWALRAANVSFRTLGAYETSIPCRTFGRFNGTMVVTARAFASSEDAVRATQISSRYPAFHGGPVHIGDAREIGIQDISQPDYPLSDEAPHVDTGETLMFWGCGILGRATKTASFIPRLITHYPAYLFLTDKLAHEMAAL